MSYEEQLRKWTSKRFDIPLEDISKVSTSTYSLGGCSTCDYGSGLELFISIVLTDGKYNNKSISIGDYDEPFEDVLKEILEA